jgi:hypothetical protein
LALRQLHDFIRCGASLQSTREEGSTKNYD